MYCLCSRFTWIAVLFCLTMVSQDCAASSARVLDLRRGSGIPVRNQYSPAFQASNFALTISMTSSPVLAHDQSNEYLSPEPQFNDCLQAPPAPKKKSNSVRRIYESEEQGCDVRRKLEF
mmetsp:Transcript_45825/g.143763  ORF Transcript_45825/g.143763 Transcript_45825/m.143763 type:complete len:119 (-) Transcript_45825:626-982(-)